MGDKANPPTDRNAFKNYHPNTSHLGVFIALVAFSGITMGYGLAYTNNTTPVINAVLGWTSDQEINLNDAIINSAFSFGAAFGS
jgi:hypothetical protein